MDTDRILTILENIEDEGRAADLLKQFNDATAELGKLILNLNPDLDSDQWKQKCDQAKQKVDRIVSEIENLESSS